MPKLTSKPVGNEPVWLQVFSHGVRDYEKRHRSINCAALGIQDFTSMFLLKDPDEVIPFLTGFLLRFGKLCAECLDGFFESHNLDV